MARIVVIIISLVLILIFAISLLQNSPKSNVAAQTFNTNVPINSLAVNSGDDLEEIKLVCRDKKLRPIWLELLQEKRFTKQLFSIRLQEEYSCSEMLDVKEIDLNDDGKTEFLVWISGLCYATGNCPYAIYVTVSNRYSDRKAVKLSGPSQLFYTEGMLNFEIQKTKTNGFKDILFRHNGSSYSNYLEYLKFDGKKYKAVKCFDEDKVNKPTPTKCWKEN